jgi:hypothetical protein
MKQGKWLKNVTYAFCQKCGVHKYLVMREELMDNGKSYLNTSQTMCITQPQPESSITINKK